MDEGCLDRRPNHRLVERRTLVLPRTPGPRADRRRRRPLGSTAARTCKVEDEGLIL